MSSLINIIETNKMKGGEKMKDDKFYNFRASIELRIYHYINDNCIDENGEFVKGKLKPKKIIKYVQEKTGYPVKAIIDFLLLEAFIEKYIHARRTFKNKLETDEDYQELLKAIEKKRKS